MICTYDLGLWSARTIFGALLPICILSVICDLHICIFRMERDRFRGILERLHNFIACRLFPPKPEDLPPLTKCSWWIPCATKVMALLSECTLGCSLSLCLHPVCLPLPFHPVSLSLSLSLHPVGLPLPFSPPYLSPSPFVSALSISLSLSLHPVSVSLSLSLHPVCLPLPFSPACLCLPLSPACLPLPLSPPCLSPSPFLSILSLFPFPFLHPVSVSLFLSLHPVSVSLSLHSVSVIIFPVSVCFPFPPLSTLSILMPAIKSVLTGLAATAICLSTLTGWNVAYL